MNTTDEPIPLGDDLEPIERQLVEFFYAAEQLLHTDHSVEQLIALLLLQSGAGTLDIEAVTHHLRELEIKFNEAEPAAVH